MIEVKTFSYRLITLPKVVLSLLIDLFVMPVDYLAGGKKYIMRKYFDRLRGDVLQGEVAILLLDPEEAQEILKASRLEERGKELH